MTSSSSFADRRRARAIALLVAGAVASGCRGEEVFETQALVLAETEACAMATATGVRVNAYRVVLFELTEPPNAEDPRLPCAACLEDGTCPIAQLACRCGGRIPPNTLPLNRELEGIRFPMLDPDGGYCVGMVGYEVDGLAPRASPAADCDCGFGGAELSGASRICGVTPFPFVVEENSAFIPITVDCRPGRCAVFE